MSEFSDPTTKDQKDRLARSNQFVHGYTTAEKEFMSSAEPVYQNPFAVGVRAFRGYEEAVYDFTQK